MTTKNKWLSSCRCLSCDGECLSCGECHQFNSNKTKAKPTQPKENEWEKRVLEICKGDPIAVTWIAMTNELLSSQKSILIQELELMDVSEMMAEEVKELIINKIKIYDPPHQNTRRTKEGV